MTKQVSYLVPRGDRQIAANLHYPEIGEEAVPVIIFLHGYKGFKDWGHFPLVAEFLARSGFAVIRFNFSHNGTTPENPAEFADLEAFGRNTFSKELEDVSAVIDDLVWRVGGEVNCDPERIGLLGHSRGGGIAVLSGFHDKRVKAVATWAGVSDFEPRVNPPNLDEWKKNKVVFIQNARTGQSMPQYIDVRKDFYAAKKRLSIPFAVNHLAIPLLIVHGTADESVPFSEAESMSSRNLLAKFEILENANHTFGGKHPWESNELPPDTIAALQATISFFRENL
jgi:uncharacterized protein